MLCVQSDSAFVGCVSQQGNDMALRFKVDGHHFLPSFNKWGVVQLLFGGNSFQLLFPETMLNKEFHGILCREACLGCERGGRDGSKAIIADCRGGCCSKRW